MENTLNCRRLHLTKKVDTTRDTEVLSDETDSLTEALQNVSKVSNKKGVRFDTEGNASLNLQLNSSEVMSADTQAVSTSDSSLMMAATQAVAKFSESSIMTAATQQVMSESALMMASTQAVDKCSESSIMTAETQQVMSESSLMMASTQAVAKFSDSPLMTQDISADSNFMNAETQSIKLDKQSESSIMDQEPILKY